MFRRRFDHIHTPAFFSTDPGFNLAFQYPAPAAWFYLLCFRLTPSTPVKFYLASNLVLMMGAIALFARRLSQAGLRPIVAASAVAAACLAGYCFFLCFTIANIEIFLFLLLAGGVWALLRGHFMTGAVLIAFCASVKLYPFVLLGLLLPLKRYKEIVSALVVFFVSNIISLWLITPNIRIAQQGIQHGLDESKKTYMLQRNWLDSGMDHSLFGFYKVAVDHFKIREFSPSELTVYMMSMATLGLALYFLRIRRLPLLNQITCLYVCMLTLTPESFEYTLMHLYVPLGLLALYVLQKESLPKAAGSVTAALVILAFLLSADNEVVFEGVSFYGQVKCVALMGLLSLALTCPWENFQGEGWLAPEFRKSVFLRGATGLRRDSV